MVGDKAAQNRLGGNGIAGKFSNYNEWGSIEAKENEGTRGEGSWEKKKGMSNSL